MNIAKCFICTGEDTDLLRFFDSSFFCENQILVLTNQHLNVRGAKVEDLTMENLRHILLNYQSINKFIITRNSKCSKDFIIKIINELITHSKIIYNYCSISAHEAEEFENLSKKYNTTIHNYCIANKELSLMYKKNTDNDVPIIFICHTYPNIEMDQYAFGIYTHLINKGYTAKYITNSIYQSLFDSVQLPITLYDTNISNSIKSAHLKDYIASISIHSDVIICCLTYSVWEEKQILSDKYLTRDLLEDVLYELRPDYLIVGILNNMCSQTNLKKLSSCVYDKFKIQCDIFLETPYICNPFSQQIDYFHLQDNNRNIYNNNRLISVLNYKECENIVEKIIKKLS